MGHLSSSGVRCRVQKQLLVGAGDLGLGMIDDGRVAAEQEDSRGCCCNPRICRFEKFCVFLCFFCVKFLMAPKFDISLQQQPEC